VVGNTNQWTIGHSPNGPLQVPLTARYIRTGTVTAGPSRHSPPLRCPVNNIIIEKDAPHGCFAHSRELIQHSMLYPSVAVKTMVVGFDGLACSRTQNPLQGQPDHEQKQTSYPRSA
jgi:hypothetical protein